MEEFDNDVGAYEERDLQFDHDREVQILATLEILINKTNGMARI